MNIKNPSIQYHFLALLVLTPCLVVYLPQILPIWFFTNLSGNDFNLLPLSIVVLQNSLYVLVSGILLLWAYYFRHRYHLSLHAFKSLLFITSLGFCITLCFQISWVFLSYKILKIDDVLSAKQLLSATGFYVKTHALMFIPLGLLAVFLSLFRQKLKSLAFIAFS